MAALSARTTPLARRDETASNLAVIALQRAITTFHGPVVATPWLEAVYRQADR